MNNHKKGLAPLLIVLVLAIVVGGGVYIHSKNVTKEIEKSEVKQNTSTQATSTVQSNGSSDHTKQVEGWKTYTSSKLGVSFQYPSDWRISREDNVSVHVEDSKHPSKYETDNPSNTVVITFAAETKQSSDWATQEVGSSYMKGIYKKDTNATISLYAITKADQVIEDKIAASITFTPVTHSSNFTEETIVKALNATLEAKFEMNSNGKYETTFPNTGGNTMVVNKIVKGDLNSDGKEDAFISARRCGVSCGSSFFVVLNGSTKALRVDTPNLTTSGAAQIQITDIIIKQGIISITGDTQIGGSSNVTTNTFKYKLSGNSLVSVN
jgi:hypothetical protein